jgi:hypothetical protein
MEYTLKDFTLVLIDEPLQEHVVAWEKAARALRNEDAKPLLNNLMTALNDTTVTAPLPKLIGTLQVVSDNLKAAIKIIDDNETVTVSSRRGEMVKAAITAGWIISPELTPEAVDKMKPWLVTWIAGQVAALYNEATDIPKN